MIKPEQLLEQALASIAGADECVARRAVSAAYYALFHAMISSGAGAFDAGGPEIVDQVSRLYEHRTMYKACLTYLEPVVQKQVDPRLTLIAQAFVDLQDARHRADYDINAEFSLIEAARLVANCRGVFNVLDDVFNGQQGRVFLTKMLFGPRLGRRG